jgi:hypothetical protein
MDKKGIFNHLFDLLNLLFNLLNAEKSIPAPFQQA